MNTRAENIGRILTTLATMDDVAVEILCMLTNSEAGVAASRLSVVAQQEKLAAANTPLEQDGLPPRVHQWIARHYLPGQTYGELQMVTEQMLLNEPLLGPTKLQQTREYLAKQPGDVCLRGDESFQNRAYDVFGGVEPVPAILLLLDAAPDIWMDPWAFKQLGVVTVGDLIRNPIPARATNEEREILIALRHYLCDGGLRLAY